MWFTPDIDFTFFVIAQSISFDTNVLLVGMFWNFIDKIACSTQYDINIFIHEMGKHINDYHDDIERMS